ncbi:MAG: thioredoxin-disulfide reductase [Lachnospiraceae bacterium]
MKIHDLIIIGTGPAGLSAGIYAKRAKLSVLALEQNYISGGQITNTYEVDNYPGVPGMPGMELGEAFKNHAVKFDLQIENADVQKITLEGKLKFVHTDKEIYYAKTVIIATGARYRLLQAPGEDRLTGLGVSYCATCDGFFFKGKTVAVVGGGNTAFEDAIYLSRFCEKVYIVHRRDEARASQYIQEKAFTTQNIEMVWSHTVDEIIGDGQVSGLRVKSVKDGSLRELSVAGVFVAVGILPNTENFAGLLTMDAENAIVAGEDCKTNVPGIYAAGDVRTKKLRQVITAAADGANAVTSAEEFLM